MLVVPVASIHLAVILANLVELVAALDYDHPPKRCKAASGRDLPEDHALLYLEKEFFPLVPQVQGDADTQHASHEHKVEPRLVKCHRVSCAVANGRQN